MCRQHLQNFRRVVCTTSTTFPSRERRNLTRTISSMHPRKPYAPERRVSACDAGLFVAIFRHPRTLPLVSATPTCNPRTQSPASLTPTHRTHSPASATTDHLLPSELVNFENLQIDLLGDLHHRELVNFENLQIGLLGDLHHLRLKQEVQTTASTTSFADIQEFWGLLTASAPCLLACCFSSLVLHNNDLHGALDNVRHEEVVHLQLGQARGKALSGIRFHKLFHNHRSQRMFHDLLGKPFLRESLCLLAPRSPPRCIAGCPTQETNGQLSFGTREPDSSSNCSLVRLEMRSWGNALDSSRITLTNSSIT